MLDLEGKSIVVTGGASGMARQVTILLARRGAAVTILDINAAGAAETISMIPAGAPGKVQFVHTDMTKESDVHAAINAARMFGGPINGAANIAAIYPRHAARLHDISLADWDHCLDVDLRAQFILMKEEISAMIGSGGGTIVNVASSASVKGLKFCADYSAAKAGLLGLSRAAAVEYASDGIRINTVLPGATLTPMTAQSSSDDPNVQKAMRAIPMQRAGEAREIAEGIVWFLSDHSSYATGAELAIDGGLVAS